MSKEIICSECNTTNTPGSKFCKSCGTHLLPQSSLICPNCNESNPQNRLYCDNCGTRLMPDAQVTSDKTEEGEKEPSLSRSKTYSLPVRPPGDTGELDLTKEVPDWLRGKAQSLENSSEEGEPPKKSTGELPDWLVDELDSKPIVNAPEHVSTEDYLSLIQDPENEGEPGEEETAVQANLPDWLTNLASPTETIKTTIPDDKSTADEPLNDWLSNITQNDEEVGDHSILTSSLEEGLTSLSQSDTGLFDSDDFGVDDNISDKNSKGEIDSQTELSQTDSDSLIDPNMENLAGSSTEEAAIKGEMFDWLTETINETGPLGELPDEGLESSSTSESALPKDDLSSWLIEEADTDISSLESPSTDDTPPLLDDLSDWLNAETDTAVSSLEPSTINHITPSTDDLSGWLDAKTESADAELESTAIDESDRSDGTIGIPKQFDEFLADEDESWQDKPSVDDDESFMSDAGDLELPSESEQTETETKVPSPDWLADLGEESLIAEAPEDDAILTSLLAAGETTNSDLDWFANDQEKDAVEPEPESISNVEALKGSTSDTDWLAELEALGAEAFEEEETAVADEEPHEELLTEEQDSEEDTPALEKDLLDSVLPEEANDSVADEPISNAEPDTSEAHESDWLHTDTMLSNALQEEMPDWLDELGSLTASASTDATTGMDDDLLPGGVLPDWIEQMKPGTVFSGTGSATPSKLSDISEPLTDLPAELSGAELPDWLENAADTSDLAETSILSIEDSSGLPDWLQADSDEDTKDTGLLGLGSRPQIDDSDDDWVTLLRELPKAAPPEDSLVEADIPDWIKALQPRELSGEAPEPEPEKPMQELGPLSGIRDVINVEPIIVQPRISGSLPSFSVTNEQQSQAALLKQLVLAKGVTAEPISATSSLASMVWVRVVLAGLLLAAIAIGLFQPDLLPRARVFTPPHVTLAHSAIQDAIGQPVLLAIEYTPALKGELGPQAEMLIAQLEDNGSSVLTVSQYSAGTAVAHNLANDQPTLGLVPGESVGLRQLGGCLSDATNCATVTGRNLDEITQQTLADVGLIIVLTGERDSLINWLEQVGRTSSAPVIAGVTQSLGPVAAPYFESGQLKGMIVGLPDTDIYQQEFLSTSNETINQQLSAQTLAQLLIALLLLLGSLGYGLAGLIKRGESSQV